MGFLGAFNPVPGFLTGFVGTIVKVRDVTTPETITRVTWRVNDAPSGGVVTIRLHDQADGLGSFIEATIADGTFFISVTGSLALTDGMWQEITVATGAPMALSGEFESSAASGITAFFTTLAKVKLDAKITDVVADRDAVINNMIAGVTRRMQDWMQRDIVPGTTVDEKIDGFGFDEISTRNWPITNITALTEEGLALVEDTDFELTDNDQDDGTIIRISGTATLGWVRGRRNIVVTYDHGYASVPESLCEAATALVIAKFFETRQSGQGWRGLLSKGVDPNASTNYDKEIWERDVLPAMESYTRMRV